MLDIESPPPLPPFSRTPLFRSSRQDPEDRSAFFMLQRFPSPEAMSAYQNTGSFQEFTDVSFRAAAEFFVRRACAESGNGCSHSYVTQYGVFFRLDRPLVDWVGQCPLD